MACVDHLQANKLQWLWLSKPMGSYFGVGALLILEPILMVGLGCSLGVRFGFDPWPSESGALGFPLRP